MKLLAISVFSRLLLSMALLSHSIPGSAQEISESFIAEELARTRNDPDNTLTLTNNAPRQYVFNFLVQRVHEYVADASRLEFDHTRSKQASQLAAGSLRTITLENGETLVQRFLRFEPPQTYAYFVDMVRSTVDVPLAYSLSSYELTEIDSDTTQLQTSVVYQSSSRLLAFFVRRGFNNALRRDFAEAARIIESEYQASR